MLIKHGVDVTVVADGSEAVDLVVKRGVRFNLAFFDLNMPIMGGVEALHSIRQANVEMPVIAISASVGDAQFQRLIEEGFSVVTTKPLSEGVCQAILKMYGHVPPLDLGVHQPPAIARSSCPTRTIAWGDDMRTSSAGPFALSDHDIRNTYPARSDTNKEYQYLLLVVEDDEASRKILQRIVERDGSIVEFAVNGVEAVAKAMNTPYDVILMDCNLPLKDGWQATRKIREWELAYGGHGGRRVPIIAVTANAMMNDRARCIDAGMDDYLTKPVQRTSLLHMAGTHAHACTHILLSISYFASTIKGSNEKRTRSPLLQISIVH
jgi:CheY-like chemotaxis protein